MTLLPRQFNSGDHEDMNDFSPVPEGDYIAQIHKSSMENCKETAKDPNGKYLKLEWKVISPKKYQGRLLWTQLNIINKNTQAVEIAQKELATICRACGIPSVQDSQQLHGIPCKLKVDVKPATAQWPASNRIKYYEKADAHVSAEQPSQPSQPSQAPQQEEQQASQQEEQQEATAKPKKPWE